MLKTSLEIVAPDLAARVLMSPYIKGMTLEEEKKSFACSWQEPLESEYGELRPSVIVDLRVGQERCDLEFVAALPVYPEWLKEEVEMSGWDFILEDGLYQEHWRPRGHYISGFCAETGFLPGDILRFRVWKPIWQGGEDGDVDHRVEFLSFKPILSRPASRNWYAARIIQADLDYEALRKRVYIAQSKLMLKSRGWWKIRWSTHGGICGSPQHSYAMIWAEPPMTRHQRLHNKWQAHGQLVRADCKGGKAEAIAKLKVEAHNKLKITSRQFDNLPVDYH